MTEEQRRREELSECDRRREKKTDIPEGDGGRAERRDRH